jgi:hypothetical protein
MVHKLDAIPAITPGNFPALERRQPLNGQQQVVTWFVVETLNLNIWTTPVPNLLI